MVPLSRFYPKLMPLVMGCPQPLADQALLDSAIEFCERSLVLGTTLDPVSTVSGTNTYDVNLPTGQAVAVVLKVWYEGNQLRPAPVHSVNDQEAVSGTPLSYYGWDTDEGFAIRVYPTPDAAGQLVVRAALKPSQDATQLHTSLFNDWHDAIVAGAVGRIRTMPDQPFTDYATGQNQLLTARTQANSARVSSMYGKSQVSMAVMMRRF